MKTETKFNSITAKQAAKEIAEKCSDCFSRVQAVKSLGRWVVNIDGGSGACYGRTIRSLESAEDLIRIFAN